VHNNNNNNNNKQQGNVNVCQCQYFKKINNAQPVRNTRDIRF